MPDFDALSYNWAPCVPEIFVTDFAKSLSFYQMLGFKDMYQRPNFAYLEYYGAQFMICQRSGTWETDIMERPYGRGVNFQFSTRELDALMAKLSAAGIPLYEGPVEKWRDLGGHRGGSVEFLVQDPDGYLLRFLQTL